MIYVVIGYEYHHCLHAGASKLHISYDFCVNLLTSLFVSWGKSYANPHSVDRAASYEPLVRTVKSNMFLVIYEGLQCAKYPMS